MSFNIQIKVDPGDSAAKVKQVEAALAKAEERGHEVNRSMRGAANAFGALRTALEQEQAALRRTTEVHQQLSAQASPLARNMRALAEAMEREKRILDQIHGPAKRYAADLQVLDSLLNRNKISTAEYAAEVAKLNRTLDGSPRPTAAAAAPVTSPAGISLGNLRTAGAAVGLGIGAREVFELADGFGNLQNRLRFLAGGDMQRVNSMFGQLQEVARSTRADLGATVETFVKVSMATERMGMSTGETLAFMERLNKAVALSGASSQAAQAGLIQLAQGLSAGALRGEEFNSVVEQIPVVAVTIEKSLGVTRGELRKMAEDGRLTADIVVEAFKKAGASLDRDFGNTVPTVGQALTLLKNETVTLVGSFSEATGAGAVLGGAMHAVGTTIQGISGFFTLFHRTLGDAGAAVVAFGAAMAVGLGPVAGVALAIEGAAFAGRKLHEWLAADEIATRKWNERLSQVLSAYSKEMQAVIAEADAIHQSVLAHRDLTDQIEITARRLGDGSIKLGDFADMANVAAGAIGKLNGALDGGLKILNDENRRLDESRTKVEAYSGAIAILRSQMDQIRQHGGNPMDLLTAGDVAVVRAYADAQQDHQDLLGRYGAVVSGIHKEERDRRRGIEDLKGALKTGVITQEQYNEAIKRFVPAVREAKEETSAYAQLLAELERPERDAIERYNLLGQMRMNQAISEAKYREELGRVRDTLIDMGNIEVRSVTNGIAAPDMSSVPSPTMPMPTLDTDAIEKSTEAQARLAEAAEEAARRTRDAWASGLGSIAGDFMNMAMSGEKSFGDMTEKILADLARLALQMAITKAANSGGGDASSAFAGSFLDTVLGGGANGFDYRANADRLQLPGFARGGDALVGGAGGTDSKIAMFRVTPGESIHVRTPQQQAQAASAAKPMRPNVVVNLQNDRRDIVQGMAGREGVAVVANLDRRLARRQRTR